MNWYINTGEFSFQVCEGANEPDRPCGDLPVLHLADPGGARGLRDNREDWEDDQTGEWLVLWQELRWALQGANLLRNGK